jgi:hypothetical protein
MFRACFEVRKATTSAMSVDHQPRDSESHRSVFGSVLLASKQETVDPRSGRFVETSGPGRNRWSKLYAVKIRCQEALPGS